MDYHRRNRRGRPRTRAALPLQVIRPQKQSFLYSFYNFLILSSLIVIVYLMLDYQCNVCSRRCDLYNITRGMYDITNNITHMKNSYYDLENTIQKFSSELPKIEGQIEVLEVLANKMKGDCLWNSKKHLPLTNVDIFLNRIGKVPIKGSEFSNTTKINVEPLRIGKD